MVVRRGLGDQIFAGGNPCFSEVTGQTIPGCTPLTPAGTPAAPVPALPIATVLGNIFFPSSQSFSGPAGSVGGLLTAAAWGGVVLIALVLFAGSESR